MFEGVDLVRWLMGVLALILMFGGLILILQKLQNSGGLKQTGQGRLKVKERLILDGRRRLVIVEHDDKEHLLLLGQQQETLISTTQKKIGTKKDLTQESLPDA